ncbi:MAG: SH3 domain-containing protein [Treponema sp.]|jgi:Ca2+-binding RTX toxin-like protein|nr:SH3 domain-containing protein [Treponema sp.]
MRKLIYVLFYLFLISCEKNKQSIVLHENSIEQNNTVSKNNELSIYTEITPKAMYVNSKEGLRKRSYPSLSSNVLGTLLYGEEIIVNKITITAETIDSITDYWYGIENNNDTWVFGGYLSEEILPSDSPFLIFGAWENIYVNEVILFKSNYDYFNFKKDTSNSVSGTYELYENDNKIIVYLEEKGDDTFSTVYNETIEVNYIVIDNNNIVLEFSKNLKYSEVEENKYRRIYDIWIF